MTDTNTEPHGALIDADDGAAAGWDHQIGRSTQWNMAFRLVDPRKIYSKLSSTETNVAGDRSNTVMASELQTYTEYQSPPGVNTILIEVSRKRCV